jgi:3-oxoadipate enol-lactonase/4-carboxymuconolactone decarboxylase
VPALVIAGAEDAIVPLETARALADGLPRGRLAVLEGAGHLAAIERPAPFAALVRELAADVGLLVRPHRRRRQ